jgi:hypothetical protein
LLGLSDLPDDLLLNLLYELLALHDLLNGFLVLVHLAQDRGFV